MIFFSSLSQFFFSAQIVLSLIFFLSTSFLLTHFNFFVSSLNFTKILISSKTFLFRIVQFIYFFLLFPSSYFFVLPPFFFPFCLHICSDSLERFGLREPRYWIRFSRKFCNPLFKDNHQRDRLTIFVSF